MDLQTGAGPEAYTWLALCNVAMAAMELAGGLSQTAVQAMLVGRLGVSQLTVHNTSPS